MNVNLSGKIRLDRQDAISVFIGKVVKQKTIEMARGVLLTGVMSYFNTGGPMISVVIPVFNEEKNIEELYDRLKQVLEKWDGRYEIVFVDDGSKDASLDVIKKLNRADSGVKAISFSRNFGHQIAVSAGLRYAQGDAVIVMDSDLQDRPEEIEEFLSMWKKGYQVVYAVRRMREDEGFVKRWASWVFYRVFSNIVSFDIPLDSGDFCLMDRVVVDQLNAMPENNRFVRGLRSWVGFKQIGVSVQRDKRHEGEVKYSFAKSFHLAKNAIISYSHVPLHYIGIMGAVIALLSVVLSIFVIVHRIVGFRIFGYSPQDMPGYASLMLAILFFGGIQLFAVGVVGEYVGRIFDETKKRPLFIAKEFVGIVDKREVR